MRAILLALCLVTPAADPMQELRDIFYEAIVSEQPIYVHGRGTPCEFQPFRMVEFHPEGGLMESPGLPMTEYRFAPDGLGILVGQIMVYYNRPQSVTGGRLVAFNSLLHCGTEGEWWHACDTNLTTAVLDAPVYIGLEPGCEAR